MPHPAYPAQPQQFWWLAIPEICPPGEGVVLQIDKIFWRPAKLGHPAADDAGDVGPSPGRLGDAVPVST
jgi:hypothetical protein